MIQKVIHLRENKGPIRLSNKLLLRSQRSISLMNKREITLLNSTRSSTRQKCARTGKCLANANFKPSAHLPMEKMNFTKKFTFQPIIRPNSVYSSILPLSALTVTDASFYTLNTIFTIRMTSNLRKFYKKM